MNKYDILSRDEISFAGHCADLMIELMPRIMTGNSWKPGAWDRIVAVLRDQADVASDGDIPAMVAHACLVHMAVLYLTAYPDAKRARELGATLDRYLRQLHSLNLAFSDREEEMLNEVFDKYSELFVRLRGMYA